MGQVGLVLVSYRRRLYGNMDSLLYELLYFWWKRPAVVVPGWIVHHCYPANPVGLHHPYQAGREKVYPESGYHVVFSLPEERPGREDPFELSDRTILRYRK